MKDNLERLNRSVYGPKIRNKFFPDAIFISDLDKMVTKGKYKNSFPEGAIIHYTAGWRKESGREALSSEKKYCYFFIDLDGNVFQQFEISEWGSHAGLSFCPVTKRDWVSQFYVGIEIACGGLTSVDSDGFYRTWFNKRVTDINLVRVKDGYKNSGVFERFTRAQEYALFNLSVWLCKNGSDPRLFFGHDEVSEGRKFDPGGSLSMNMNNFRRELKQRVR